MVVIAHSTAPDLLDDVAISMHVTPLVTRPTFNVTFTPSIVHVGEAFTFIVAGSPQDGNITSAGTCTCHAEWPIVTACSQESVGISIGDEYMLMSFEFDNTTYTRAAGMTTTGDYYPMVMYGNALTSIVVHITDSWYVCVCVCVRAALTSMRASLAQLPLAI